MHFLIKFFVHVHIYNLPLILFLVQLVHKEYCVVWLVHLVVLRDAFFASPSFELQRSREHDNVSFFFKSIAIYCYRDVLRVLCKSVLSMK